MNRRVFWRVLAAIGVLGLVVAGCWWFFEERYKWAITEAVEAGRLRDPVVILGVAKPLTAEEWKVIHSSAVRTTGPFRVEFLTGNSRDGYSVRLTNRFGTTQGGYLPIAKRPWNKPFLMRGGLVHFSMTIAGLGFIGSDPANRALRIEAYRRLVESQVPEWQQAGIKAFTVERNTEAVELEEHDQNLRIGAAIYAGEAGRTVSDIKETVAGVLAEKAVP